MMFDIETKLEKIEEEIEKIRYNAENKTLLVWVKDNPYFAKTHYAWLNSEEKVEALRKLIVKFTNDHGYTRERSSLLYDGRLISRLNYEKADNKVLLS